MQPDTGRTARESWVPMAARSYLGHVAEGRSLRSIAREAGVHPSTILRQVRRIEERRDEPLIDAALSALSRERLLVASLSKHARHQLADPDDAGLAIPSDATLNPGPNRAAKPEVAASETTLAQGPRGKTRRSATTCARPVEEAQSSGPALSMGAAETGLAAEALLRKLGEPGAMLVLADDMEKAVVVRDLPDGSSLRTSVTPRATAEAMALRDWLEPQPAIGRVRRYRISAAGRASLMRLLAEDAGLPAQARSTGRHLGTHRAAGRETERDDAELLRRRQALRFSGVESPVAALGLRRDKQGRPFLTQDLVSAAERLREDFELAQMGSEVPRSWDWQALLPRPEDLCWSDQSAPAAQDNKVRATGQRGQGDRGESNGGQGDVGEIVEMGNKGNTGGLSRMSSEISRDHDGVPNGDNAFSVLAARARVAAVLQDLGPGLGDVVLRCCCYLEGLESAERRLGWSSRSGKIVLRIALERLHRHYLSRGGRHSVLIG